MQTEKLFAVLGNTASENIPIKLIRLTEERESGEYRHTLSPYTPDETRELLLCKAKDKDTCLTRLFLLSGAVSIWRNGWTVKHKDTWLQVLDSDDRNIFPGEFDFRSIGNPGALVDHVNVRRSMLSRLGRPLGAEAPLQPQVQLPEQIPQFVADIMKRDAISNGSTCPISLELLSLVPLSITSCFHLFQRDCIATWMRRDHSCPVCKVPIRFVQDV